MASIVSTDGLHTVRLRARHLVGRSPDADLRLSDQRVSGVHAVLSWDAGVWRLRDLGSRNGTWIDGEPLTPGKDVELQPGWTVAFGDQENTWRVESLDPPSPFAVSEEGQVVPVQEGILTLPGEPDCLVADDGTGVWVKDDGGVPEQVGDRQVLRVGQVAWTLHLSPSYAPTMNVSLRSLQLDKVGLRFNVSRDEEHITVVILSGTREIDAGSYSFHYMLLLLARERMKNLEDPEAGWVYQEDLMKMMRCPASRLNLEVFRARRHFTELGVQDGARIVDRRVPSRQLRIGSNNLQIRRL